MIGFELLDKKRTLQRSTFKKTGLEVEFKPKQLFDALGEAQDKIDEIKKSVSVRQKYLANLVANNECINTTDPLDIEKMIRAFDMLAEGRPVKDADSKYGKEIVALFEYARTQRDLRVFEDNIKHWENQVLKIQEDIKNVEKIYEEASK